MGKANNTSFKIGHKALTGSQHPAWKGDDVSYTRKHQWIRYWFGAPLFCEHCGNRTAKRFEWANISKNYMRDRADWLGLCKSCHIKYDNSVNKAWVKKRNSINGSLFK
jgi:hypothetical protein